MEVGSYLPLFKRMKTSDIERESWNELRRRINGLVNKVNANNLNQIVSELFEVNLIRGRDFLCRFCLKSHIVSSPKLSDVIAALIAVINSRFPSVGDLLLRRLVLRIRSAFEQKNKPVLLSVVRFLAHLVNQRVAGETIALELLLMLLENPTEDNVEVAIALVTECGAMIQEASPKALDLIFERFHTILQEGDLDYRGRYLIESLVALRRCNFKSHPPIRPELDVLDPNEQLTHEISFFDEINPETSLGVFKPDPEFYKNERKYQEVKRKILGEEDAYQEEEDEDDVAVDTIIRDVTGTDLIELRRTIYLTIKSSVSFEEAGHKLLQIRLEPGQETELCAMVLECCTEEITYRSFYGHLAHRFCLRNRIYRDCFDNLFMEQYSTVHRLETNKLRSVAMFFAHLLAVDALPWDVLGYVRLTEEDTTSSSRIFVKFLFQELSEQLGIKRLSEKLENPTMDETFKKSIFPTDHPKNTRFSINFFTCIGLGCITLKLRQLLLAKRKKPDNDSKESGDETERKRRRPRRD